MKIELTSNARKRQEEIIRYSIEHFGINVAQRFVGKIEHSLHLLADNPQMGATEPLLAHRKENYRYLLVYPYKIVYYINMPTDTVYVITFFDTRRNPEHLPVIIK